MLIYKRKDKPPRWRVSGNKTENKPQFVGQTSETQLDLLTRMWRKVHRTLLMRPDRFARQYWEKNRKSAINKNHLYMKELWCIMQVIKQRKFPLLCLQVASGKILHYHRGLSHKLSISLSQLMILLLRERKMQIHRDSTIYSEQIKLPNFFLTRVQYSIFWN